MHNAILVAQEAAEEVKQNANREAELIRRERSERGSASRRMPATGQPDPGGERGLRKQARYLNAFRSSWSPAGGD